MGNRSEKSEMSKSQRVESWKWYKDIWLYIVYIDYINIYIIYIYIYRVIGQRWSGLSSKLSHSVTTHPIFIFIAFLGFSEKALNILPWRHMSMTPPSMCFRTLKNFHILLLDHVWPKNHIFTYFALFSPIIPCTRHKKTF